MAPTGSRALVLTAALTAAALMLLEAQAWSSNVKVNVAHATTASARWRNNNSKHQQHQRRSPRSFEGARSPREGSTVVVGAYNGGSMARSSGGGRAKSRLSATTDHTDGNALNEASEALDDEAKKTIAAAMNKLPADVTAYVMAYTPIGDEARQKNAMTAGAYVVESVEVVALDGEGMDIAAAVRTRSFFGKVQEFKQTVRVPFGVDKPFVTSEAVKRRLMEMSREQGMTKSTATIYKIPVGSYGGLPINMLLNNVPHSRMARNFIYRGAADALVTAVQDPAVPRRMKLVCTVPELNTAMDTYRVGTMLEMIRELAYSMADVGLNTRVLIQPAMGDGIFKSLPLALSGVMSIMQGMDWEEGLVGTHVNFGELGNREDVSDEDDVFLVISPQGIPGFSVHPLLVDTVEAANGRPVVIINPDLKDRPSSGGIMQTRGRGDRIAFAESFKDMYNFRLLYGSSVGFFPIKGAVMKAGPWEPYVVFNRRNVGNNEEYSPLGTFDDDPDAGNITPLWSRSDVW
ncbi:unnamed protein product [Pylaiella littoralis]